MTARHPRLGGALLALVAIAVSLVGLGCHPHRARKPPQREPFVALETDFQDYDQWTNVDLSNQHAAHTGADAHIYINRFPSRGASEFPVGTILVKSVKDDKQTERVFAMAKRGGAFNLEGARGWEWFELARRSDNSMAIVWRGTNSKDGHSYGGGSHAQCNGCHEHAIENDFVQATSMRLPR